MRLLARPEEVTLAPLQLPKITPFTLFNSVIEKFLKEKMYIQHENL